LEQLETFNHSNLINSLSLAPKLEIQRTYKTLLEKSL